MSLPHILLGVLDQPRSGYDIKQLFDSSLKHFWFAELSQIYPALKKLVADGLAKVESAPSDKGPDKKVYSRTAAGTKELQAWLAKPPAMGPVRHGFLGQVFFMGETQAPEQALTFFSELRTHYEARLAALKAVEDGWKRECPTYPEGLDNKEVFMQLTLDAGLALQQTYLDWCDRAITRLRKQSQSTQA